MNSEELGVNVEPYNGDIKSLVLEGSQLQPKDVEIGDTLHHKRGTFVVESIGKNAWDYPTYTGTFTPNDGTISPYETTISWGQLRYYSKTK